MIVWFTGLPCSGKTTLADEVSRRLISQGLMVERMDGDTLRNSTFTRGSGDVPIGFTKEERDNHLMRLDYMNCILSKYTYVLCSFVSPYESTRQRLHYDLMVYTRCPVEVCKERDVKGMYAKAANGEIVGFTGVSAPYEEPLDNGRLLIVDTDKDSMEVCAKKVLERIASL